MKQGGDKPAPIPACPITHDMRINNMTPQMFSRHLIWGEFQVGFKSMLIYIISAKYTGLQAIHLQVNKCGGGMPAGSLLIN